MDEIIQIKCPFDGAVLSVKNIPGIETKSVTCPICKHRYPFTQFKRIIPNLDNEDPCTEYPNIEEHSRYGGDEKNNIGERPNYTLGKVSIVDSDISFQLSIGRNVIGRKAQKSEADFQIDTVDKRSMSREHVVIEVKNIPTKGFVHYISLYKEKVNSTFVGIEPLQYGDCIVLNSGDLIRMPDATLLFEIPDDERTEI